MAKYKPYDYAQQVIIPVSLEEQLMPGTLEFAIHTLVETRIDTSIFDRLPSNASKEWSGTVRDLRRKREKLEKKVKELVEEQGQQTIKRMMKRGEDRLGEWKGKGGSPGFTMSIDRGSVEAID